MPELSYRAAVRDALAHAMRRDPDVFVMGEDIAEMGGSMGVTSGMLDEFGKDRVRNTPISEMALAGAAIGAAMQGMRPIAEIMYEDFMTLAAEQVVNQAAKLRYMSGGQLTGPVVFRTQGGAGWSPVLLPNTNTLNAIAGTNGNDIFVVGVNGTILHWPN